MGAVIQNRQLKNAKTIESVSSKMRLELEKRKKEKHDSRLIEAKSIMTIRRGN